MSHRLLKGLSVLLGALTSCSDQDTGYLACPEYGCNDACTITGRVVDAATQQPIMGIAIGDSEHQPGHERSDPQGLFEIEVFDCCHTPTLYFQDIDGEDHGGCYEKRKRKVHVYSVGPGEPCSDHGEQVGEAFV